MTGIHQQENSSINQRGHQAMRLPEPLMALLTDVAKRSDYQDEAIFKEAKQYWLDLAQSLVNERWPECQQSLSHFWSHLLQVHPGNQVGSTKEVPSYLINIPRVSALITNTDEESEEVPNLHSLNDTALDIDQRHFLLKFLRASNHCPNQATKCLKNYIKLAQKNPGYYQCLTDRDRLQEVLAQELHYVLPKRDNLGRRVFIFRPGKWNMNQISFQESYSCCFVVCEMMALEARSQIAGCTVILDGLGFGWRHFMGVSINDMTISIQLVQVSTAE